MTDYDDKADAEEREYTIDLSDGLHEARIDELNEIIDGLKARIAELEALGPLIEEYGQAKWSQGYDNPTSEKGSSDAWVADLWGRINAILEGGA